MVKRNPVRYRELAPGVTIYICEWGNVYDGRDEDLIASKIIWPDCIPGKPGQRKTVAYMERAGRKIEVRRTSKRKLSVREYFSKYDLENPMILQENIGWVSSEEQELIRAFRRGGDDCKRILGDLARDLAGPDEGADNVIDFTAYRRKLGYIE